MHIYTGAVLYLITQSCLTLWDSMDCGSPDSSVHEDSPGKNIEVGCHVLLQGIFLTQVSNSGLLYCRGILYHLSHQGSPRTLEWVAYPYSGGSSWPRNWTGVPVLQAVSLPAELPGKAIFIYQFSQSCLTLCDPMNCSTPGLPVHHQLLEFTQTHVHWVRDAIHPSHPLLAPSPPAPNPSQHQGLFQWVNSSHEVAKVLEFQLQHQSFQWTLRTDLL